MAEPEARSPCLAAVFIWLVTLFNIVIALARTDVSKAQLIMLVALAFSSGMFAAWTPVRRGSAS